MFLIVQNTYQQRWPHCSTTLRNQLRSDQFDNRSVKIRLTVRGDKHTGTPQRKNSGSNTAIVQIAVTVMGQKQYPAHSWRCGLQIH